MALLGALCATLNCLGVHPSEPACPVSALLGSEYSTNQMSYDLVRLRRNDLITRLPGTNTYHPTADGQGMAIFYTKVHNRLLNPLMAPDKPPADPELRAALATIKRHITTCVN